MGLSVLDNVLVPAYGSKDGYEKVRERAAIKARIQDVFHALHYLGFCISYTEDEELRARLKEASQALQDLYRELVDKISKLDGGEL